METGKSNHVRTLRELDYHERTSSLLLGYSIGTADTAHGKLTIVAAGATVRFSVEGLRGHVDLDLTNYANAAVAWLARDADTPQTGE